jgi:hypothetical protein
MSIIIKTFFLINKLRLNSVIIGMRLSAPFRKREFLVRSTGGASALMLRVKLPWIVIPRRGNSRDRGILIWQYWWDCPIPGHDKVGQWQHSRIWGHSPGFLIRSKTGQEWRIFDTADIYYFSVLFALCEIFLFFVTLWLWGFVWGFFFAESNW